eukprot:SAG11_NODE_27206_length_335_cov_1.097458_1_plen_32_part_00
MLQLHAAAPVHALITDTIDGVVIMIMHSNIN